jgi:hypothetical protein
LNIRRSTLPSRPDRDGFDFVVSDNGLARDPDYKGKALQLDFTVGLPPLPTSRRKHGDETRCQAVTILCIAWNLP